MKRIIFWCLISLLAPGYYAESSDRREIPAKGFPGEGALYFENLYATPYKTIEETDAALQKFPDDEKTLIACANYYFISGAQMPAGNPEGVERIKKSLEAYKKAWKMNFSNPRVRVLLAAAHMSRGGDSNISIEEILDHIFRAKNLFSMVLNAYPENLDALLGRIRIDMNLNAATGRSDVLHIRDIEAFLAGYEKLPQSLKDNLYFKMGLMETRLASAKLDAEKKDLQKARAMLNSIDTKQLHAHAMKMYHEIENDLKKN